MGLEGNNEPFLWDGELKKRPKLEWDVGAIIREVAESSVIKRVNSSTAWEKTFASAKTT